MALILVFHNDSTGTDTSANYDVQVFVGDGTKDGSRSIEKGRLEGHDRNDGWARLVLTYLVQRKSADRLFLQALEQPPKPNRRLRKLAKSIEAEGDAQLARMQTSKARAAIKRVYDTFPDHKTSSKKRS